MMRTYNEFWDAVKAQLRTNLKGFKLTDEELEKYMIGEKEQIDGEYRHYRSDIGKDKDLSAEAFFKACVNGIAYCLEMCY